MRNDVVAMPLLLAAKAGERTRLACRVGRPRATLLVQALDRLFGEAPKTARGGACAPRKLAITRE
jgi:hypothetical protein